MDVKCISQIHMLRCWGWVMSRHTSAQVAGWDEAAAAGLSPLSARCLLHYLKQPLYHRWYQDDFLTSSFKYHENLQIISKRNINIITCFDRFTVCFSYVTTSQQLSMLSVKCLKKGERDGELENSEILLLWSWLSLNDEVNTLCPTKRPIRTVYQLLKVICSCSHEVRIYSTHLHLDFMCILFMSWYCAWILFMCSILNSWNQFIYDGITQ